MNIINRTNRLHIKSILCDHQAVFNNQQLCVRSYLPNGFGDITSKNILGQLANVLTFMHTCSK